MGPLEDVRKVTSIKNSDIASASLIQVSNTDTTRAEVRQFLGALLALAFVMATLGVNNGGTMAFATDIVLALCGAWCANQLIRGKAVFKEQVICVLQVYFIGLACCSVFLFAMGWLVFLPSEYLHLGNALLYAATFTTNIGLALFPVENGLRFDGVLNHLWVPALIAQCVLIVSGAYWAMRRNTVLVLFALSLIAFASLAASSSTSPIVQLLPIGGLWAFLFGAIPFLLCNRYPILHHALLLGIVTLLIGVLVATATGDTLTARAFMVLGISFLYVGSRPVSSAAVESMNRRRVFALALHIFLWIVPMSQIVAGLDLSGPIDLEYGPLLVPTLFLSIISWSIWHKMERRVSFDRITPTLGVALMLLATGLIAISSHGAPIRFSERAQAYLYALNGDTARPSCDIRPDGPLAGLRVCEIGPKAPATVLIWGDHQLSTLATGYAEAARRSGVSALVLSSPNCIPLAGLQTRQATLPDRSVRTCEQHTAQILQALPHLKSIRQVTLVADWLRYSGTTAAEFRSDRPIQLGPNDGTPINPDHQFGYIETAAERTVDLLAKRGLRVTVLRQVPAQPQFDAEIAARANASAGWMYHSLIDLKTSVPLEDAVAQNHGVDQMFRRLSATGRMTYVNTWPTFCSSTGCHVRGGLSSDYVTSTLLSHSGALSLSPVLEQDLKRSRTHTALKRALDS